MYILLLLKVSGRFGSVFGERRHRMIHKYRVPAVSWLDISVVITQEGAVFGFYLS